jgi:hypothetical protein
MVYVIQGKTPDDGQKNCPKHVKFYSKNKFEKLVYLVGFITKNSSRCTMHDHMNVKKECNFTEKM